MFVQIYQSINHKINYIYSLYPILDTSLKKVDIVKDFVVLFDSRLNFTEHVTDLHIAASKIFVLSYNLADFSMTVAINFGIVIIFLC